MKTIIAKALGLREDKVEAVIALLGEGCTIPFISRYRKEVTGNMDEVQITAIADKNEKLLELQKRKATVLKTIEEQGKLSEQLKQQIEQCWDATLLEDIYLPYKPKRRTRAMIARSLGLEPLATLLLLQREQQPERVAQKYVKGDVADVKAALDGAKDIIAEMVSEDSDVRNRIRGQFSRVATITSTVIKKVQDTDEAQKFSDYFDFSKPLKRCSGHQLLAMRRGEAAGILRVSISVDANEATDRICQLYVRGRGACQTLVEEAVADSYKRLIAPSMENEFAALSKEQADDEAIKVFVDNLRQLLLSAPLGQKRTMALDPGYRNGCKMACLDAQGMLLHHEIIYPHSGAGQRAKAADSVEKMLRRYQIEAIAIGNGTASRESKDFIDEVLHGREGVQVFTVSEDGASIYSASATAREEFPDEDVTTRGAVSIGRRLMDPLAELVKIDPKSIGVGQYQHDVDQTKLKHSLDLTVESCVNQVGVNLNTASSHLLQYVSGLGPTLARNIIAYRTEHGPFNSRAELKKVARLGPAAYQQCAGFLRIPDARNPLDNTAVHPESYHVVEQMAKDAGCTVKQLISDHDKQKAIDLKRYVTDTVGLPTLTDIMKELEKPGRDPREQLTVFEFDPRVHEPKDLVPGMLLPGIVTNITNFGAFVDVGVHQDGLVHISQISNRRIATVQEVLKLHQHVQVKVLEVDLRRGRISLTMKGI